MEPGLTRACTSRKELCQAVDLAARHGAHSLPFVGLSGWPAPFNMEGCPPRGSWGGNRYDAQKKIVGNWPFRERE